MASPDVLVVSCAAVGPVVAVVSSMVPLLAEESAVAGVPTAADASSVTDNSTVSGYTSVPAFVQESLLLLAPCHVVDTNALDGIRCCQHFCCYIISDFAGNSAVGGDPSLA